jgi:hypothetical protein
MIGLFTGYIASKNYSVYVSPVCNHMASTEVQ